MGTKALFGWIPNGSQRTPTNVWTDSFVYHAFVWAFFVVSPPPELVLCVWF